MVRPLRVIVLAGLLVLRVPSAHAQWLPGGNPVAPALADQDAPGPASDGVGGVFVAWAQSGDVRAQHFTNAGVPASSWPIEGRVLPPTQADGHFAVFPVRPESDGSNGFYVLSAAGVTGCVSCEGAHLYLSRFTAMGDVATGWPAAGLQIERFGVDARIFDGAQMIVSPEGAIVAWTTYEYAAGEPNVRRLYVQAIGADGSLRWGENGIRLAASDGIAEAAVSADGDGGACVFWSLHQADGSAVVMGQRVTATGERQWGELGQPVSQDRMTSLDGLVAVSCGSRTEMVAWIGGEVGAPSVRAARVELDRRGASINGLVIAPPRGPRSALGLAATADGGAIAAWLEGAGDDVRVFAQRILPSARTAWAEEGQMVCPLPDARWRLALAGDGAEGAFLAWDGARHAGRVFATRLGASGRTASGWAEGGSPVSTWPDDSGKNAWSFIFKLRLASVGHGEAVLTWDGTQLHVGGQFQSFVTLLTPRGPAAAP
jgi:hypothetical protein